MNRYGEVGPLCKSLVYSLLSLMKGHHWQLLKVEATDWVDNPKVCAIEMM